MTRAVRRTLFQTGTRVVMPSGQRGQFVRWRVRAIDPDDPKAGQERIAVIRLGGQECDFSESFMTQVDALLDVRGGL